MSKVKAEIDTKRDEITKMKGEDNIVLFEGTPNGRGERLRACVNSFKGNKYASIRRWYPNPKDPSGEELLPGKGISVPFDDEGVAELVAAVNAVEIVLV